MPESGISQHVDAVRRFNRFYTRQIGVISEAYMKSPFSVTEARVIYELASHEQTTATALIEELGLDAGQLSRILRGFNECGIIDKLPSETDGRQNILRLTEKGLGEFAMLNERTNTGIEAILSKIPTAGQNRLVEAMHTIESLLGAQPESRAPYILRSPQPGDMGWVVQRHAALYTKEYGWNEQFEATTAEIVARFVQQFDPHRERCWIAEKDGENIGSIFLVKKSDTVARLRLLLVEPSARGQGVGNRLVEECVRFARLAGYRKIELWTTSILTAARHIYKKAGFTLVKEEPTHNFGHDLIGETWEMDLA